MSQTAETSFLGNFARNLFGAIAGNSLLTRVRPGVDFIPLDGKGKTLDLSGKNKLSANWLGLRSPLMQKYAYEYCYPVASVCDRLAEADTTGLVQILKIKGKGKEDLAKSSWAMGMNELLAQPNVMQTWEQFRGQQTVYKKVFGYCPVFPIKRAGFENIPGQAYSSIINIPPWCFDPVSTGKMLYQSKMSDFVKEYKVTVLGQSFRLKPDEVFILTDSFLQDENKGFLVPMSRLCGLDMAVSNLCAAMEADNVMLRRSGPAAVFSSAAKDGIGSSVPMSEEERAEAQHDLSNYGMSWNQFQFMISRNPLTLQTVGFNHKQLGSKETIVASEKAVCHRYNYSYVLYEDSGATYANQDGAHKALYQNNVIPGALKDMHEYNKFFKAKENDCTITIDFSHLPILQKNEKERAGAAREWDEALRIEYESNLITLNEWRTARGYDTKPDGDVYYSETKTEDDGETDEGGTGGNKGGQPDETETED